MQPLQKSFKLKVAIFFGYNGENYNGLQWQNAPDVKTIQNIIQRALFDRGFILESNMSQPKRVKWSRAARTDKKVHALCNAISLKLEISPKYINREEGDQDKDRPLNKLDDKENIDFSKIIMELNSSLPKDIRLYAMRKVTKRFDIRHDAKYRLYQYLIPSFVFQSQEDIRNKKPQTDEEFNSLIQQLRQQFQRYIKTHSFHNFTKGMKETDPKCKRHMVELSVNPVSKSQIEQYCGEQKIESNIRWIRFTLLGQSFIYHQIRKMIGLLVQLRVRKLNINETFMKALSEKQKFKVFLAPGAGLYLDRVTFDSYDMKSDAPERLQLTEQEEKKVEEFRVELEKIILRHEYKQDIFTKWVLEYYDNPDGIKSYPQSEEEMEEEEDEQREKEGEGAESGEQNQRQKKDKSKNKKWKGNNKSKGKR